MVTSTECFAAGWALSIAILDEIINAVVAENVAAGFEHMVADVGVADRANGKALLKDC